MRIFFFEILIGILALTVFIIDILSPEKSLKHKILGWLTAIGLLLISLFLLFISLKSPIIGEKWGFSSDNFSLFFKGLIAVSGIIGVMGSIPFCERKIPKYSGEYFLLILLSIMGMSFLVSARNILLFFVGFELMSIPLYALTGFDKENPRSPEASMKFIMVGALSSGILFFGLSLIYGSTGASHFSEIAEKLSSPTLLSITGTILFLVGIGFKIAVVPFHTWLPDVYEAAPASYVSFLSVAPKAAGFAALSRFLFEVIPGDVSPLFALLALLSALTMTVGNLLALPQTNIKRLLAYSSVAHIGYILIGIAAQDSAGVSMVLFYLFTYIFSNMGAFLVVEGMVLSEGSESIDALKGLSQRAPILSMSMLLFLLSLGGIPFVAGFWAKLFVFWAGIKGGLWLLVLLGAILTIVALFYYLMVARRMYIEKEEKEERIPLPLSLKLSIGICLVGVILFGILPFILVNMTDWAVKSLF